MRRMSLVVGMALGLALAAANVSLYADPDCNKYCGAGSWDHDGTRPDACDGTCFSSQCAVHISGCGYTGGDMFNDSCEGYPGCPDLD